MINEILADIKNYFSTNETKNYDFRIEQLNKLKTAVLKYKNEIVQALNYDLKKPEIEAYYSEINPVIDEINYAIENLKDWMKEREIEVKTHLKPSKTLILSEPYGVVLIIVPFNYPVQLALIPLIGAISAGNCAVLKITKRVPYTAKILAKIINETFIDEYIKIFIDDEIPSESLIEASFDYIFFTGSSKTGALIAKSAASRLIPYTLELGGKSPAIVDETADLALSAKRILKGKLQNCGQTCIAPDYLYVQNTIKEQLILELKKAIKHFYGVVPQQSNDYSRIVDSRAIRRLDDLLSKEIKNIVYGGLVDECGLFIEPTILDNIEFNSPVMQEEIFGPILPVISWVSKDEAIYELKKTDKPLALYVFSKDEDFIKKVVNNISYGGGCINDTLMQNSSIEAPFGGVGKSGIGRYHGKYSFDTFSNLKTIFINNQTEVLDILYPPYSDVKLEHVKKMIDL